MTWRDVEPTWNLVIGALSVFQLDWLSTIRVSCFFVIWDRIQVFVGYEPGLLFVRILNPVPRMSWLACVWKTVIRLPMFPVLRPDACGHNASQCVTTRQEGY